MPDIQGPTHNSASTERLLRELDSQHEKAGDDATVRLEARNTSNGRSVRLILDPKHKSAWQKLTGYFRNLIGLDALQKGRAAEYFSKIEQDHEVVEVPAFTRTSLADRKVDITDAGEEIVHKKSGGDLKVLTYTEVKAILDRDLAQFELAAEPVFGAADIRNNIARYLKAGSYGEQRLKDDLGKLSRVEQQKLSSLLEENSGDVNAIVRDARLYEALGQTGQVLVKEHLLAITEKYSEALSSLIKQSDHALAKDSFLSVATLKAWGQDKAKREAANNSVQSGSDLIALKQKINQSLTARKASDVQKQAASEGVEYLAAAHISAAVLSENTNQEPIYINADDVRHVPKANKQVPLPERNFQSDLSSFSSVPALTALKEQLLVGGIDANSSHIRQIDQRQVELLSQTLTEAYASIPDGLKANLENFLSDTAEHQKYTALGENNPSIEIYSADDDRFKAVSRYADIALPVKTAVTDDTGNPVYHASKVKTDRCNFIACQAPGKPGKVDSFWDMVAENESPLTVCLTNATDLQKKKTTDYVPAEGTSKTYEGRGSPVTVAHKSSVTLLEGKFEIQQLEINGKPHTRIHYHGWEDQTPSNPADVMMLAVLQETFNPGKDKPTVMHCSAGVGRTGACMAVTEGFRAAAKGETVKTTPLIHSLREQRGHATVQTAGQLENVEVCLHYMNSDAGQALLKTVNASH